MKHQETSTKVANALTLFSELEKQTLKLIDQEWNYRKKIFSNLSNFLYFLLKSDAIIVLLLMLMILIFASYSSYPRILSHIPPVLQNLYADTLSPAILLLAPMILIIFAPWLIIDKFADRYIKNDRIKKIYDKYRFTITPYFSMPVFLYAFDSFIPGVFMEPLKLYALVVFSSILIVTLWITAIFIGPSNMIYMISIFSKKSHLDFSNRVVQKLNKSYQETLDKKEWERIQAITREQATDLGLQSQLFSRFSIVLVLISIFITFGNIVWKHISDVAILVAKHIRDFFVLDFGGHDVIAASIFFMLIIVSILALFFRYFYFSYARSHAYSIIGLFCQIKLEEMEKAKRPSSVPLSKQLGCYSSQ
uniref:Uncharacterized protein n=1 Tax=Candidatus Kentrum sp. MB TaxID=2138164 RepID=A0A450XJX9_9GAMM|nr:MAG: hypothetical protein BECKMB1821G_GA0114241_104423 [Candidatus Kentron sp. MB]VFK29549.1 MAG: hypothetical protein BECKMB1821I_GA0114274_101051 [Candidatus Kentron sp. MB]VFK74823.1 MAG: hypothetical protein BECKMB1821H_GA0114242_101051 [Candidatus Kentron sp. MB]